MNLKRSVRPQQQHEPGAEDDPAAEERVEQRRLARTAGRPPPRAERFADDVGRRERQHGGGEQAGVEDAEAEQAGGEVPGERLERAGEVHRLRAVDVERRLVVDHRGVMIVAALAMIMKPAIAIPRIEPTMMSSAHVPEIARPASPLSTTADCKKNCMYGEIVVPIKPTTVTRKPLSFENVGTNVSCTTAPQSGLAMMPGDDVAQVDHREHDERALDDLVAQPKTAGTRRPLRAG